MFNIIVQYYEYFLFTLIIYPSHVLIRVVIACFLSNFISVSFCQTCLDVGYINYVFFAQLLSLIQILSLMQVREEDPLPQLAAQPIAASREGKKKFVFNRSFYAIMSNL